MLCNGSCVSFDANHCGDCTTVCSANQVCSNGVCASSCSTVATLCGSACVVTNGNDALNCGGHAANLVRRPSTATAAPASTIRSPAAASTSGSSGATGGAKGPGAIGGGGGLTRRRMPDDQQRRDRYRRIDHQPDDHSGEAGAKRLPADQRTAHHGHQRQRDRDRQRRLGLSDLGGFGGAFNEKG